MANAALSLGRPPSSLVLLSTTGLSEGGACHLATISSRRRRKGLSRPRLARPWPLGLTRVLFLRRIGPVPFTGVCVPGPLLLLLRQLMYVMCSNHSFIFLSYGWKQSMIELDHSLRSLDRRVLSRTPQRGSSSALQGHTQVLKPCSYRLFHVSQCLKVSVERGGEADTSIIHATPLLRTLR
jgi:hypothetical protein